MAGFSFIPQPRISSRVGEGVTVERESPQQVPGFMGKALPMQSIGRMIRT